MGDDRPVLQAVESVELRLPVGALPGGDPAQLVDFAVLGDTDARKIIDRVDLDELPVRRRAAEAADQHRPAHRMDAADHPGRQATLEESLEGLPGLR